jgi:hypothetical protein
MNNILSLTNEQAKDFFLKNEHYFSVDIPKYFDFSELINKLYTEIENDIEVINNKFLNLNVDNKDKKSRVLFKES